MTRIEQEYMNAVKDIARSLRDKQPDWEQRRYEIARDVLAGIISDPNVILGGIEQAKDFSISAVRYADALIAELKKGGKS